MSKKALAMLQHFDVVESDGGPGEGEPGQKTAEILANSSTRSAQDAYTWWDWVFRGCVIASALILAFTLGQCCYFRHLIHSLCTSTHAALVLSPLKLPTLLGLGP
ncbi:hypothetical protein SKAU_G00252610 [Synaphobranchus kaupii]|uniref:Uncharacterized protein n=1 Tax=Synaphobranchus kaupii TaxID=118154 RepID=A0A9Q1F399_SYNKA|nr:hypothetical protein SKAU_G00252610 [Synaphobranchus kaupii]